MKNTEFKVEDMFVDIIKKHNLSQDQIFELFTFFGQTDVNINMKINFIFL